MTNYEPTIKKVCDLTGLFIDNDFETYRAKLDPQELDWFLYGFLTEEATLKANFGEEDMFLIDISPDWAHDMGDVEHKWVEEKELEEYCKAELKAFKEEHKGILRDKDKRASFEILCGSIISKWEDPFSFALMELPAFQVHRNQMGNTLDSVLEYYEEYLKGGE